MPRQQIGPSATKLILTKLAEHPRREDALVLETLIRTGARSAEVVAIRKDDINLVDSTVFIRAVKDSLDHMVPIPPSFAKRLLAHLDAYGSLLGYRTKATSVHSLTARLHEIFEANRSLFPPQTSLHSLRAAFAILVYSKTKDILLVQQLLGHKHLSSTQAYVRMSTIHLQKNAVLRCFK